MFNTDTEGRFSRCCNCGAVYNECGLVVAVHNPMENHGEIVTFKITEADETDTKGEYDFLDIDFSDFIYPVKKK